MKFWAQPQECKRSKVRFLGLFIMRNEKSAKICNKYYAYIKWTDIYQLYDPYRKLSKIGHAHAKNIVGNNY